jgi:head-tail adaptor
MIGPKTSIGRRFTLVTLQNPSAAVPDGDGGTTQAWFNLSPDQVYAAIRSPTAQDLERLAAGTVIATGQNVLTFPFHPQVSTATRALWLDLVGRSHVASVTGVDKPEQRCNETVCLCVELLDATAYVYGGPAFNPAAFLPRAFNTGVAV